MTRPDISFAVQTLSQFLQSPKKSHMEAAIRIVKYVKRQPAVGILLSSKKENKLTAYFVIQTGHHLQIQEDL